MKKQLVIILFLFVGILNLSAQDIIYKKSHEEIKAKVTEIGLDEIKYKMFDLQDGPDIVISKNDIWKIKFNNGEEMIITNDAYDASPDVEIRNKIHAVKFEFFSPLTDDIAFGYEQMIKVGMNFEGKIGIIGVGTNPDAPETSGAFVKAGVKFKKHSDIVIRGMKYAHALSGAYIKPEIIFSHFVRKNYTTSYSTYSGYPNYTSNYIVNTQDVKVTHIAAEIVFGKQFILGQTLTLDYYVGIGYGYMTTNLHSSATNIYDTEDEQSPFYYGYGHMFTGKKTPFSFSSGLTLGVLF